MQFLTSAMQQGTLQAVLTEFCKGIDAGIYAVHAGRSATRNAAVFIDFVRDALPTFDGIEPGSLMTRPPAASSGREMPCPAGAGGH